MRTSTLIYTSQATEPFNAETVQRLADRASRKNAQLGITGLLLYGSGNFLQVLEGNATNIRVLFEQIRRDRRHTQCELLYESERQGRLFPNWHMGALNLDGPGGSSWELISSTLSHAGAVDWQDTDPVIGWVREFMAHNASNTSSSAA